MRHFFTRAEKYPSLTKSNKIPFTSQFLNQFWILINISYAIVGECSPLRFSAYVHMPCAKIIYWVFSGQWTLPRMPVEEFCLALDWRNPTLDDGGCCRLLILSCIFHLYHSFQRPVEWAHNLRLKILNFLLWLNLHYPYGIIWRTLKSQE